jgi:hypothetical protein
VIDIVSVQVCLESYRISTYETYIYSSLQWGYCGPDEGYCYIVDDRTNADGTFGGGGVGNDVSGSCHCCSQYGYCGEGPEYWYVQSNVHLILCISCTKQFCFVDKGEITTEEELIIERAPLPDDLLTVLVSNVASPKSMLVATVRRNVLTTFNVDSAKSAGESNSATVTLLRKEHTWSALTSIWPTPTADAATMK